MSDEAIVDQVERVFEHALSGGTLGADLLAPFERRGLEFGVGNRLVDCTHRDHVVGAVFIAEEEDLTGKFLADLAGEVGRTEATVEAGDIGVGLLELGVLGARQCEVGHDMQRVPAASSPARNHADDDLGHEADQPLHFEDVEASGAARHDCVGGRSDVAVGIFGGVLVSVLAADALIATGTERPSAVFGRRSVAGQEYAANVC